jgi:organic radical activating enzyme
MNEWTLLNAELAKAEQIVIFGAGVLGKNLYHRLKEYGYTFVFCDNNKAIQGTKIEGIQVYSLEEITNNDKKYYYLIPKSKYQEKMRNQLIDTGVDEGNIRIVYNPIIPLKKLQFEVQVTEHCNLNCKYCNHMSPLADKDFLDINEFEKDMKRIGELTGGTIERMFLLGGEPLLHPDIAQFCILARKYIKAGKISIVTNGILINNMSDDFWSVCKENDIAIEISEYPIGMDYKKAEQKLLDKGVALRTFVEVDSFYKLSFDLDGNQNVNESFKGCSVANSCIMLSHGRMYPCAVPSNIKYFNRAFNKNLGTTESDSVDIYKVKSLEELMERLSNPIPFCRYCDVSDRSVKHQWQQSDKSLEEWVRE